MQSYLTDGKNPNYAQTIYRGPRRHTNQWRLGSIINA